MNKKILYTSMVLGVIILIGAVSIMTAGPINITSEGLWEAKMLNISYLAEGSDVIVMGEVKEILPSRWTTADGKRPILLDREKIYTDVIIRVDDYLKNPQPTKEITVRTLGGTVGEDRMINLDEAEFEPNEKVLLLLTTEDPFSKDIGGQHYRVIGWMHGKFKITNNHAIRPKLLKEHQDLPLQEVLKKIQESK